MSPVAATKRRKLTAEEKYGTVAEQIRDLSMETLECRSLRHAWKRVGHFYAVEVEGGVRGAIYVERKIECARGCGVFRHELYRIHKTHLERLTNAYRYPKTYPIHGSKKGLPFKGMIEFEVYLREMAEVNNLS